MAIDRFDAMTPFAERLEGYELQYERTEAILGELEVLIADLSR